MKKLALLTFATLLIVTTIIPTALAVPQDPYIIQVTVLDENGTAVSGAQITIKHVPTDETATAITDTDGWAWYPLDNLTYYSIGDTISITATKGELVAHQTITVDATDPGGKEVTLTLAEPSITPTPSQNYLYWMLGITALAIIGLAIWYKQGS